MGLPLLTEKIASKIGTAMMWAVYDGDVPFMYWLFDPSWGGERLHGGEVVIPGEWRGIPVMSRGGSTRSGSTTEEYSGTRRWLDGRVKVRTGYN